MQNLFHRKIINMVGFGAVALVIAAGLTVLLQVGGSTLNPTAELDLSGQTFSVTVAETRAERFRGLSEQRQIGEREGMWFVFETPGNYGFVMRDMNFAIDIIWVDSNKTVVGAAENARPESYPGTVFNPPEPIQYVLEVPAGSVEKFEIEPGDVVEGPN